MATAGLRRLDKKIQEAVLESCRKVLHASSFQFRDEWASVITGKFLRILLDSMGCGLCAERAV